MLTTHPQARTNRRLQNAALETLESRQLMSVQVTCHSQVINNGDTIATNDQACYEFGFFRQGDPSNARSITYDIANNGPASLKITQITVPQGFKITSGPAANTTLDDGDFKDLTIQLDKNSPGQHMGNVVIKSSDGGTFTFEIAGSVGSFGVSNGNDLGTIGTGHRTDSMTFFKENDGSGTAVLNPGISIYHFDLTNPHNNVTLDLKKPNNSDPYGVNMKIYRDANDDGTLQISEEQEIFPLTQVDPTADSPTTHTAKSGSLAAGSYLIKCFPTTSISDQSQSTDAYEFTITAVAQPDPKIQVQASKKTPVADNDLTPSEADGTDFATVPMGSIARRDFIVTNTGNAPLLLSAATLTGNTGFAIDAGLPSSIPAGGTARLGILMLTTGPGDASAQVVIPSNDPLVGQFNFAVSGHVNAIVHATSKPPVATLETALRIRMNGGTFYKFTIRYTDDTGVDLASINSSDITVTGPAGFVSPVRLLSKTSTDGGKTVDGFYRLAAPGGTWNRSDNGLYTFNLNEGEVTDMGANPTAPFAVGQFTCRIAASAAPAAVSLPVFSDKLVAGEQEELAVWAA